ncbi:hypothetical protein [Curtobacterium sp. MCBA15_012]|uniref:hypothetical protein n=1 Tax=Curtobacterium sp. MCBA15_012 TaxID=1898738 RepID=UPI0009191665|nr:hypothetical protein [Curtobacterium sp. MCBA15_012]WIB00497.1 hypothetical protein QOL15_02050 [Curtobacterium sp. MCBA15_012]
MTLRTKLALGAALLALTAGSVGVDATGIGGVPSARAAEEPAGTTTTSTPSVSVSAGKLKRIDTIELGAESLVFRDDDKTVADVSMRDAASTVDLLNRLLGTPSRTQTAVGDGGACFPSGTTYTWGGAVRVAALTTPSTLGNAVEIRVLRDSVRSRTGAEVELTGPDGVQVGDDVGDRLQDAPRSDKVSFGDGDARAWQLLLEAGWAPTADDRAAEGQGQAGQAGQGQGHDLDESQGQDAGAGDGHDTGDDESGTNGVSALTNGTVVSVLGSPMPVHAQRSC